MDILALGTPSDGPQEESPPSDSPLVLALTSLSESLLCARPAEAFDAILDFAETFIGADASFLVLKESRADRLAVVASHNLLLHSAGILPCLGEGLVRATIEGNELLCVDDIASDARDALGSLYSAGYISASIAPVLQSEVAIGALGVLTCEPRKFSLGEIQLLTELARQASDILVSRGPGWTIVQVQAPDRTEIERHRSAMRSVGRLTDAIIAASTMDELLQVTLEQSMEAAEASVGSLMLYDNRSQLLTVAASKGLAEDVVQKWGSRRIGEGLSGWVAQNEKPLLLKDIYNDPRTDPRFRMVGDRDEIISALLVPLRTRSRLIGVMNLARHRGETAFNDHQVEVMETVANQIAIAIERMRLHQEIRKRSVQLSTLMEVGKTITSMLDLGVVTEQITLQLRNLARSDSAFLYFYDPINDRVRLAGQSGCPADEVEDHCRLASDLALSSARQNRHLTAKELKSDNALQDVGQLQAHEWAAVPFRHRGHRIAIGVVAPKPGLSLDMDVTELLEQFGAMAAVAIQNARTYNREHAIAKVMQGQMAIQSPIVMEGLEIAHRLVPQHEVGGDYYDFISLGEGKLGIVVADVSGSSLRAAAYTTLGKHALRAYAREYECPAEVLTRLNRLVYQESGSEIFISLFYGMIDLQNETLTYAMAGHEPPLLFSSSTGRVHKLRAPGMLLGVSERTDFEYRRRGFRAGDVLALYTDGLTEAPVNKRTFGLDRLKEELRKEFHRPLQEIVDAVISSRMKFSQNRNLDDMALVVVRAQRP